MNPRHEDRGRRAGEPSSDVAPASPAGHSGIQCDAKHEAWSTWKLRQLKIGICRDLLRLEDRRVAHGAKRSIRHRKDKRQANSPRFRDIDRMRGIRADTPGAVRPHQLCRQAHRFRSPAHCATDPDRAIDRSFREPRLADGSSCRRGERTIWCDRVAEVDGKAESVSQARAGTTRMNFHPRYGPF